MKSLKLLLAVLSLSAAFLAPSVFAQKEGSPDRGKGRMGDPLKMLTERLSLTEAQVAQVKPIVEDEMKAMAALRDDTSLDQQARRTKSREIMQSHRSQIRAVLTPEQQAKYDEMPMRGGQGKGKGKGKGEGRNKNSEG